MLLCLDRERRLTLILGAIFELSDTVAAEVLEISPDNFRQRLARARRDLRSFMNSRTNPRGARSRTKGVRDRQHIGRKMRGNLPQTSVL